jgi:hypothetical protein
VAAPGPPGDLGHAGLRFWTDTWSVGLAWLSPQLDFPYGLSRRQRSTSASAQAIAAVPLLKEPITTAADKTVGELERWLMMLPLSLSSPFQNPPQVTLGAYRKAQYPNGPDPRSRRRRRDPPSPSGRS